MLEPSKPIPSVKRLFFQVLDRDREMLPHAGQIDESQIDNFDAGVRG
jgi:hypothetical protein